MSPEFFKIVYWRRDEDKNTYAFIVDDDDNHPCFGYPTFELAERRVLTLSDPDYIHAIVTINADQLGNPDRNNWIVTLTEYSWRERTSA